MDDHHSSASGAGLERLCAERTAGWIHSTATDRGVEFLEAWFQGPAYRPHRHDTYAICLTTHGVQVFDYRGATRVSLPGQVVVLHPDEQHDGRAGTAAGFGYRLLYVEPARIFAAVQALSDGPCALPFVREPVTASAALAVAITRAFGSTHEPLALDYVLAELATGLCAVDQSSTRGRPTRRLDRTAVMRACALLDAETTRVVRSEELEAVTGLNRYELARQFRRLCGTSPYRYALRRRLDRARAQIVQQRPLADVALATGFADQAHLTRLFRATYGVTPAHYRTLLLAGALPRPAGSD